MWQSIDTPSDTSNAKLKIQLPITNLKLKLLSWRTSQMSELFPNAKPKTFLSSKNVNMIELIKGLNEHVLKSKSLLKTIECQNVWSQHVSKHVPQHLSHYVWNNMSHNMCHSICDTTCFITYKCSLKLDVATDFYVNFTHSEMLSIYEMVHRPFQGKHYWPSRRSTSLLTTISKLSNNFFQAIFADRVIKGPKAWSRNSSRAILSI